MVTYNTLLGMISASLGRLTRKIRVASSLMHATGNSI